jgi:hypothetical protein
VTISLLINRHAAIAALAGLVLLGAQRAEAQQAKKTFSPAAKSNEKFLLVFDEQKISDDGRAQIYALLSATVPKDKWPKRLFRRGKNLGGIVLEYFQFFSKVDEDTKQSYPKTTDALIKEIQEANNIEAPELKEDTLLSLPPVPVRGHTFFEYPGLHFRTYRPSTQCYESTSTLSSSAFCDTSDVLPATAMEPERLGNLTAVELDVSALSHERLQAFGEHLPPHVSVRSQTGYVRLKLFQQNSTQCNDATEWLNNSPYLPLLQRRLMELGEKGQADLAAKARRMPLVVLDWDVQPNTYGHGAKVLSVTHYLLHSLGLDFISELIVRLDLRPGPNSQEELLRLLRDYQSERNIGLRFEPFPEDFKVAEQWIRRPPPLKEGAKDYQIPEMLVQALFWKLSNNKSWVNFSFAFYGPTMQILASKFVAGPQSFAFLAAGNTPVGLASGTVPQDSGSSRPNLINVTYGQVQGTILGSFTNTKSNMVVSLVAPGCGFAYESIGAKDEGSSFASPYVGTAAWLKYLLDDVSVNEMRRWLILASRPVAPQEHPVESRGVFDPARLLSFPQGPHYVGVENDVVFLKAYSVDVCFTTDDHVKKESKWQDEEKESKWPNEGKSWRTLFVYPDKDKHIHVVLRETDRKEYPHVLFQEGLLTCASLVLTKANGDSVKINHPSDLAANLKELSF